MSSKSTRFVSLALFLTLAVIAAACAPAPTPVPTAAPPTAAPKATTAPVATTAPAATAAATTAAAATSAPTAAAKPTTAPTTAAGATSAPTTAAAATTAPTKAAGPTTAATSGTATNLDALIAAAKQEGQLTTIALPHDWCGYGDVIAGFQKKYGLKINELNPDAGSGDEVEAIKANKDNKGPQAPDVIDVGLAFGPQVKADKLVQPYKVSTWDSIPADAKDADGYWYGDYYGVLAFEINSDLVKKAPVDWADLLTADYKNSVAMAGDPRVSSQAYQAVFAAGLSTGASQADAAKAGLDFWAKVNKAGNFVPVIAKAASVAKGETPIVIRWDYNALADKDTLKGNPKIEVVVPKSGVVAGVYIQAISAYAPHPNAAKLWMEYLYSDEGQLGWLKGYCHPIRFNQMSKDGKIPADVLAKLPPAENYAKAVFPTLDTQNTYKDYISKNWDTVVGATVK